MAYPRSAAFTWRRRFVDEREACPTQATMKAHPSPLHFVLYPALRRRWRSLIAPLQQRYVSVLARSANAAAQLAYAQAECEATAMQSAEMQGSVSCCALSSAARTALALRMLMSFFGAYVYWA